MQIDVARAIEEVLDQRKAVNIQGLGSLMLEDTSASISGDKKKIAPPSAKLRFYKTNTKNGPLRKHLMYKYDLSKEEAQKVIKKFSQSVVKALDSNKEVNIKGVTNISKLNKGIEIKPKKSFIDKYYGGLPVLDLPKSETKSKSKTKAKSKTKSKTKTKAKSKKETKLDKKAKADKKEEKVGKKGNKTKKQLRNHLSQRQLKRLKKLRQ